MYQRSSSLTNTGACHGPTTRHGPKLNGSSPTVYWSPWVVHGEQVYLAVVLHGPGSLRNPTGRTAGWLSTCPRPLAPWSFQSTRSLDVATFIPVWVCLRGSSNGSTIFW